MVQVHAWVLHRFPNTPWVYGGAWSWFSTELRCVPHILVYPYVPLVLVDTDNVSSRWLNVFIRTCEAYGIPWISCRRSDEEIHQFLEELEAKVVA